MCKNIYKSLISDFQFLRDYGYNYVYTLKHFVFPSVMFSDDITEIVIGFSYENHRFFVNFYEKQEQWLPKELLSGISLPGKTYKEQLNTVQEILEKFLILNR